MNKKRSPKKKNPEVVFWPSALGNDFSRKLDPRQLDPDAPLVSVLRDFLEFQDEYQEWLEELIDLAGPHTTIAEVVKRMD